MTAVSFDCPKKARQATSFLSCTWELWRNEGSFGTNGLNDARYRAWGERTLLNVHDKVVKERKHAWWYYHLSGFTLTPRACHIAFAQWRIPKDSKLMFIYAHWAVIDCFRLPRLLCSIPILILRSKLEWSSDDVSILYLDIGNQQSATAYHWSRGTRAKAELQRIPYHRSMFS